MSVEQLQRLHGRYASLSHHFRAAWAFNQYLESLSKVFTEGSRRRPPLDFQELYGELRGISERLTETELDQVRRELDRVERALRQLDAALLEEDNRVSPYQLRQFLQRVRNQDEKLLVQLVKFYVYSREEAGEWPQDRFDKVDFLLTKVAEEREETGRYQMMERSRLRELSLGLWRALALPAPPEDLVEESLRAIRDVARELAAVDDLDELNARHLVPKFREVKQRLGLYLLEPRVLLELLETNLAFKNLIHRLYSIEERRIVADYQRIFELEQEVTLDGELDTELGRFRGDIERFEERLRNNELKLEDLAQIRSQVRWLSERLNARLDAREGRLQEPVGVLSDAGTDPGVGGPATGPRPVPVDGLVEVAMGRIRGALAETDRQLAPRQVTILPEIFPLRLEPREVVAYRRLTEGATSPLELFVLEAAAWRLRLGELADEIKSLLDETARTGEAPVFGTARHLLGGAGAFPGRFEAEIERLLLAGDADEARRLVLLKMRFVREHADLWLATEKPRLRRAGIEV